MSEVAPEDGQAATRNDPPLPERTDFLASTVHDEVRDVLKDELRGIELGKAVIRVVDIQLRLHAEQDVRYHELVAQRDEDIALPVAEGTSTPTPTLFAHAAARIAIELGQASPAEARKLAEKVPLVASPAFIEAVHKLARLPYAALVQALHFAREIASASTRSLDASAPAEISSSDDNSSIDDWIIKNEKYLRARLVLDAGVGEEQAKSPSAQAPPVDLFGIDRTASHWKQFMVGLGRDAHKVFRQDGSSGNPNSGDTLTITRPSKSSLPGLLLLDNHRKDKIWLNTLAGFSARFESMTGGILKGLDWSNVLVAGGIALGALTSVTDEAAAAFQSSDVDVYLYGLAPHQADAKLRHIEQVFASNLPVDESTGKKLTYAVLRNRLTITFVPERFPHRRVQVVLKLCPNPMAILLNFDLDQIGLGFTGEEVWMLPRTARALVTGYTTFTMDLIHGSFLSPRKATQDQRVFKYAERGYGLRFLPSYIKTLPEVPLSVRTTTNAEVSETSMPRDELHVTLREERERIEWWMASYNDSFRAPLRYRDHNMVDIDCRHFNSAEPAERSSLGGWQLFARHVAMWELEQAGYIILGRDGDRWVQDVYADDPLGYQDGPEMSWDASFSFDRLRKAISDNNEADSQRLTKSLYALRILGNPEHQLDQADEEYREKYAEQCREWRARWMNEPEARLQRTVMADSLEKALAEPLVSILHLPENVKAFAEEKLPRPSTKLVHATKADAPPHANLDPHMAQWDLDAVLPNRDYRLCYWLQGGDGSLDWQLVNRESDEVLEVICAYRRAHRDLNVEPHERDARTRRQLSRRLARPTERSERAAFRRWALERVPVYKGFYVNTEHWAMLNAPRSLVFRRMEMTQELADQYDEEHVPFIYEGAYNAVGQTPEDTPGVDLAAVPTTAAEFLQQLDAYQRGATWKMWYYSRLPPAHLLPELETLARPGWGVPLDD